MSRRWLFVAMLTVLTPVRALAHHEHGDGDFGSGLLHLLTGLDHLIVLTLLGLWAAKGDKVPVLIPTGVVALFALWHRWAFGAGTPVWTAGMIASSVALLGLGIGFAKFGRGQLARWAGAGAMICAAWFVMG